MAPRNSSLVFVGVLLIALLSSFTQTAETLEACVGNVFGVAVRIGGTSNEPCTDTAETKAFKDLCKKNSGTARPGIGGPGSGDPCFGACLNGVVPLDVKKEGCVTDPCPTEKTPCDTPECGLCCCA